MQSPSSFLTESFQRELNNGLPAHDRYATKWVRRKQDIKKCYNINEEYLEKITELGTPSQIGNGCNPRFSRMIDIEKLKRLMQQEELMKKQIKVCATIIRLTIKAPKFL